MTGQANGGPKTPEQVMIETLQPQVRLIVSNTIRGIMGGIGNAPLHIAAAVIAQETAAFLANCMVADLSTSLQLRKLLKDSFDNGIKSVPTVRAAAMPDGAQTSVDAMLRRQN